MDLDWEKLFKRYVWHDERTPYLTRVADLVNAPSYSDDANPEPIGIRSCD